MQVRFSAESAVELHKQLYRAKLASLVEKGRLTPADRQDLQRITRILCLPEDIARKVERETCGRVLDTVLTEIFLAGAKPVPEVEMARVEAVVRELGIERDAAVEALAGAARERMRGYVTQAQKDRGDQRESVGHLKKLVQFNQAVVTPLLWRLKGHEQGSSGRDDGDDERRGQAEINLRSDMDERTRAQVRRGVGGGGLWRVRCGY